MGNISMNHSANVVEIHRLEIQTLSGKNLVALPQLIIKKGEVHAIIGESGSGKSLTLLSLIGLLNKQLIASGEVKICLENQEISPLELSEKQWQQIRGKYVGMIFQEPMTALNPQKTCGDQLFESAKIHQPNKQIAKEMALKKLDDIGLGEIKERIWNAYPHQLSGGQRQRVMIAMAAVHEPPIILADEPTTALDSLAREEVMSDLQRMCKNLGSTLIWVSHELDLVQKYADNVTVLKRGEWQISGTTKHVLDKNNSLHPYVKELIDALPEPNEALVALNFTDSTLELEMIRVNKEYNIGGNKKLQALKDIDLQIHKGETIALVGLSGSGKSTLAKILVGLENLTDGTVKYNGLPLKKSAPTGIQMVFQDPYSSLNPNHSVQFCLQEVLMHGSAKLNQLDSLKKATELLDEVGLNAEYLGRYPHELSGGQRQRLCIARALASNPQMLILDEAVAALDPIVQKQVLELLMELQDKKQLSYLFITHNLHVARSIAHKIVYLEKGQLLTLPDSWKQL